MNQSLNNGWSEQANESKEPVEWEEWEDAMFEEASHDIRRSIEVFLKYFLPPVVLIGVFANVVITIILAKRQLWKKYQVCIYLLAISINNIVKLIFVHGLHFIYLINQDIYFHLTSSNFSCKLIAFLCGITTCVWWLMSGILMDRLLQQQLSDDDDDDTAATATPRSRCHLLRSSFWKAIAIRYCTPKTALIFVISTISIISVVNLPNFVMHHVSRDYCHINEELVTAKTFFNWYVMTHTVLWLVFFLSFLIILPLIICSKGSKPTSDFRQMFDYAPLEDNPGDQNKNFTNLSLVLSIPLCIITLPLQILGIYSLLLFLNDNEHSITVHNASVVLFTFHCVYFSVWPIICLVFVPVLRQHLKEMYSPFTTKVCDAWNHRCCRRDEELCLQVEYSRDPD